MHFDQTVTINAAPEKAWAVLTDVERAPEWTASMTSVKRLDDGPFRVGSRARIRQPWLLPATWRVDELSAPSWFAWETHSPTMRIVAGHRIDASPGGCTVTLSTDLSGVLAPVIGRVYRGRIQRYINTEANGLKARCESTS